MSFTHLKSLEQLASEGRAAWSMMMKAIEEHDKEKTHFWNLEWHEINNMIRDGFYH